MKRLVRVGYALVTTLILSVVYAGTAMAQPAPDPGAPGTGEVIQVPGPVVVHHTSSGVAIWAVVVIAVSCALVAMLLTQFFDIVRQRRQTQFETHGAHLA